MDILVEQLVYGSFPFWGRGYDVLARSPGCRAEWVGDVLGACRKLGEAPSGLTPASSLFALRLPSGPWAIVRVEPQGVDDRGRPGALAFHALLVDPGDYRKAGSNPFVFTHSESQVWTAETTLQAVFCSVEIVPKIASIDPRVRRVVEALSGRRRVAIESPLPIETLAREVWPHLPASTRRRASVATWSFGNANRFDLVGLPRLAGVELDRSYLEPGSIDLEPPQEIGRSAWRNRLPKPALWAIPVAGLIGLGLAWRIAQRPLILEHDDPSIEIRRSLTPDNRAKIRLGVETLAERFELGASKDPGEILARLSERYHYRGPILTPSERTRLIQETDPDRDRAIAWDERIRRTFLDDQPIPDDFDRLPLDQQLDRVARSFHLLPVPRSFDIPDALLQRLSRTGPIQPTPLAGRYPALSDYARFLGKLPRVGKVVSGQ